MNIRKGIKLLQESIGSGKEAKPGDDIEYELSISLNKGERIQLTAYRPRSVDDDDRNDANTGNYMPPLVPYETEKIACLSSISRDSMINGVYYSCIGMKEGGYRKVKVAPIWGHGERGVKGKIPPNAVLVIEIWLKKIL